MADTAPARQPFYKDAKFWGAILAVLSAAVASVQTGNATWSGALMGAVGALVGTVLTLFVKSPSAPDAAMSPPGNVTAVETPSTETDRPNLPPPYTPM